jgi:SAM-dependent MidA family methyltransferase
MAEALYGDGGFYRAGGAPGRHFRTSAHASPQWAAALAELARQVDQLLGEPVDFTVVDMGAGGGEVLADLAATAPARWRLVGVEIAPRPGQLPARVDWTDALPVGFTGVLLAVEWLDVVPVDVVELTEAGPRLVEVTRDGRERPGPAPSLADADWLQRWWPLESLGDRAEVGLSRDEVWADAVRRLTRGVAVAVDYAAVPARDLGGTLTGYREGRQLLPVPDGSCDITAHVLLESCATACDDVESMLLGQREALGRLGVSAPRPAYGGDPTAYLTALSAAGEAAELLDPAGLGAFTWLLQAKGTRVDGMMGG